LIFHIFRQIIFRKKQFIIRY